MIGTPYTLAIVECVRRNQTLVPREPFDVTVHIVPNDFGPLGCAYVEADETDADEATIVENLLSGQYSHPVRVIAFNTVEGWARDVTEDVAQAVLNKAQSEHRSISVVTQEFFSEDAWRGSVFGRLTAITC